jgi:hypothetical protein
VAGKGVIEADPYGETSVTPAWRKAVVLYLGYNYIEPDTSKEAIRKSMEESSALI